MTIKVIKNANVVLEYGIVWDGVIIISDDRIINVGKARDVEIPSDAEIIDAGGAYVGPGFIDIHVHGGGGYHMAFNPKEAAEHFLRHGETSILTTPSYSMSIEQLLDAISNTKEAMKTHKSIKGIYMEGPYTNPRYGANQHIISWRNGPIKAEDYERIVDSAGDLAKVWTIAPEREGILPFVEYVRKVNPKAVFAVGHSEATPAQIRALGKYRPKIETHSTNATGQVQIYGGGIRNVGPDEYSFMEPELYTELICDSKPIHVCPDMQRLIIHNKGINRVILITDSTVYNNPTPAKFGDVDDINFDVTGGVAGSKLTLDKACRNIMTHTNCGIAQAFIMASLTPARALGWDDDLGSIEVGKVADLVFVDDKFNVQKVMLQGTICEF